MHIYRIIQTLVLCALIANSANASDQSNTHPFSALNARAQSVAYWTGVASIVVIPSLVVYAFVSVEAELAEIRAASEKFEQSMKDECDACMKEGGTAHHCCGYFM